MPRVYGSQERRSCMDRFELSHKNLNLVARDKTPKRVQRKRTKGWKMPVNTVYVGRPTIWGNPWETTDDSRRKEVLIYYETWLRGELIDRPHMLDPLKGKDLACWCPLDKPCHADVLLKFLKEVGV